jgi:hypothetical protein
MIRRWLIRVPCLLALALVVGVWITSYFGELVLYAFSGNRQWEVDAIDGLEGMGEYHCVPASDTPPRFAFMTWLTAKDMVGGPTILGFRVGWIMGNPDSLQIIFPLWLPTVLLAGLNWFVWRKTRSKGAGRGFPVEPATAMDATEAPQK